MKRVIPRERNEWIIAWIAVAAWIAAAVCYAVDFFPYTPMHSDANGYYLYLPAVFVYHDPGFHFLHLLTPDPSGLENIFYLMPTGEYADKYTIGVALLQAPFFLAAHLLTLLLRPEQADGYTGLYQLGSLASSCFYYYIGSLCTYRIGKRYASAKSSILAVLSVTFGTALFHYITRDGGYSHVYSFACISLFILLVIHNEEHPSMRYQLLGGLIFGILTLVRVTNAVMIFIYLLFGVTGLRKLRGRLADILRPSRWIGVAVSFIAVWLPQLAYWKWSTGHLLINTYQLPGNAFDERFYWLEPKIAHVLFFINRGLFFWCPIVILSALGMILCRKRMRDLWTGFLLAFVFFTYITASWWAYDGFCGFTNRFFVDLSAVFMIAIAVFYEGVRKSSGKWAARITRIFAGMSVAWTMLFMVEYWFNETTILDVHWNHIVQVLLWYRGLLTL